MQGFGFYIYDDKVTYDGQFVDDKKQGYGLYQWTDGRKYKGWWNKGKQHGFGIYTGSKKDEKFGLWEYGKRITWLDEAQVAAILSGEFDHKPLFK